MFERTNRDFDCKLDSSRVLSGKFQFRQLSGQWDANGLWSFWIHRKIQSSMEHVGRRLSACLYLYVVFTFWKQGGAHFSFMNQMNAGQENFKTLVESVLPILSDSDQLEAEQIAQKHFEVAANALNEVWRCKLGLAEWSEACSSLIAKLLGMMHENEVCLVEGFFFYFVKPNV